MTEETIALHLISLGCSWAVKAGGVHWQVNGREQEKFSAVVKELSPDASPAHVAWLLTSALQAKYEEEVAQELALAYWIEHRPAPGKVQLRWYVNGVQAWPGPIIERIRARIAGQTGFFPAASRTRTTRIATRAAELCQKEREKDDKPTSTEQQIQLAMIMLSSLQQTIVALTSQSVNQ